MGKVYKVLIPMKVIGVTTIQANTEDEARAYIKEKHISEFQVHKGRTPKGVFWDKLISKDEDIELIEL